MEVPLRAIAHVVPWGVNALKLADKWEEALINVLQGVAELKPCEPLGVAGTPSVIEDAADIL